MVEIFVHANDIEYKPNQTINRSTNHTVFDNIARYLDQNVEMRKWTVDEKFNQLEIRLDLIESRMEQEEKLRESNEFVNDLYIQYQAALKLATDTDDLEEEK